MTNLHFSSRDFVFAENTPPLWCKMENQSSQSGASPPALGCRLVFVWGVGQIVYTIFRKWNEDQETFVKDFVVSFASFLPFSLCPVRLFVLKLRASWFYGWWWIIFSPLPSAAFFLRGKTIHVGISSTDDDVLPQTVARGTTVGYVIVGFLMSRPTDRPQLGGALRDEMRGRILDRDELFFNSDIVA